MSINMREQVKGGRPYFTIYDNYWDATMKRSKQKTIKTLGYLDKYMEPYDEKNAAAKAAAEAKAREYINQLYEEILREYEKPAIEHIAVDMAEQMPVGTSDLKNVGYCIFKFLYKELELDKFWKKAAKLAYTDRY